MTFRTPRLTFRQGRRLLSTTLALVYFWAFVALGLTHTHGMVGRATRHPLPRHTAAAAPAALIGPPAASASDDAPCALCAAVHAAAAALVQPPAPANALLPTRRLVVWSPTLAPIRTPRASQSRAPPQA